MTNNYQLTDSLHNVAIKPGSIGIRPGSIGRVSLTISIPKRSTINATQQKKIHGKLKL